MGDMTPGFYLNVFLKCISTTSVIPPSSLLHGLAELGCLGSDPTGEFLPTALTPLVLTLDTERCCHKVAEGAKPEPWN